MRVSIIKTDRMKFLKNEINWTITCTQLNTSASGNIGSQDLEIIITNLVQPSSVKTISPFLLSVYYSENNELVAETRNTNSIVTTSGTLMNIAVAMSSLVNTNQPT